MVGVILSEAVFQAERRISRISGLTRKRNYIKTKFAEELRRLPESLDSCREGHWGRHFRGARRSALRLPDRNLKGGRHRGAAPPNPSPLSGTGGRALQFCRTFGCLVEKGVAVEEVFENFVFRNLKV